MDEYIIKWNIDFYKNSNFLLGGNINIGKDEKYLLVYLGFRTLIVGKFVKYQM